MTKYDAEWHHLQQVDVVGLWRWSVGCFWPFSPSFASPIFYVACHFWPYQELCLWSSISSLCSSQWTLTAYISVVTFCSLPLNHNVEQYLIYIVYVILLHCGASVTITNSLHVKTYLAIKLFLILFSGHLRVVLNPPCCHSSEESQKEQQLAIGHLKYLFSWLAAPVYEVQGLMSSPNQLCVPINQC